MPFESGPARYLECTVRSKNCQDEFFGVEPVMGDLTTAIPQRSRSEGGIGALEAASVEEKHHDPDCRVAPF
jgi:hypothetical protein